MSGAFRTPTEAPDAVPAQRVRDIALPATLAMMARVRALRAEGIEIVNLTIGEPDFDTPEAVRAAAKEALDAGLTKYSPVAGVPELRQAIADKLNRDNGLVYRAEEIVVANGAKQAIVDTCMAVLEPGDEVVIPAPCWAAYPGIVQFCGARPVIVATGLADGYKLAPERLAAALTPRTRLLILNSPCNPTGAVYSRDELAGLVGVLRAHPRAWILSDEIYERIDFSGRHCSVAALAGAHERTVTVNGLSKSHAMTGWRIGYAAAPAPLARAIADVQAMLTAGANRFAQAGAVHALRHCDDATARMRAAYRARRDLVCDLLGAVPGFRLSRPDGAFYAFVDVSARFGATPEGRAVGDSVAFTEFLLDAARVAVVPGAGFGDDRCVRLSTAASEAELREGIARIARAVEALR